MNIKQKTVSICVFVVMTLLVVGLNSAFKSIRVAKQVFAVQQWFAITPSTVPTLNGKTVQQAITQNNANLVTGSGSVGYSRLPA